MHNRKCYLGDCETDRLFKGSLSGPWNFVWNCTHPHSCVKWFKTCEPLGSSVSRSVLSPSSRPQRLVWPCVTVLRRTVQRRRTRLSRCAAVTTVRPQSSSSCKAETLCPLNSPPLPPPPPPAATVLLSVCMILTPRCLSKIIQDLSFLWLMMNRFLEKTWKSSGEINHSLVTVNHSGGHIAPSVCQQKE